jgi:hypothetical protein
MVRKECQYRLANFLIKYRTTPQSVTGRTPAELMVKRQLRTRLSLIKPNLAQVVENKQAKQKLYHDNAHNERVFEIDDSVRVRKVSGEMKPREKWIMGRIVKVCGSRKYLVKIGQGTRYVHVDHLLAAHDNNAGSSIGREYLYEEDIPEPSGASVSQESVVSDEISVPTTVHPHEPGVPVMSQNAGNTHQENIASSPQPLRRSERVRKPLVKMDM